MIADVALGMLVPLLVALMAWGCMTWGRRQSDRLWGELDVYECREGRMVHIGKMKDYR